MAICVATHLANLMAANGRRPKMGARARFCPIETASSFCKDRISPRIGPSNDYARRHFGPERFLSIGRPLRITAPSSTPQENEVVCIGRPPGAGRFATTSCRNLLPISTWYEHMEPPKIPLGRDSTIGQYGGWTGFGLAASPSNRVLSSKELPVFDQFWRSHF